MLFWLQLSLKTLAFNKLITPETTSGLSCLQSACVKGDFETVNAILNYSPDKLDSAIAMGIKIGHNSSVFPGKSLLTVLRLKGSETHKQISELVEKVTKHFQSQSLLHLAAKRGNTEHLRRLLECGEHVDSLSPDLMEGQRETPLMLAARYNDVDVVEFLIERGASLEAQDIEYLSPIHHAVAGGKMSNVLRLIELGAKVSKENLEYTSPVHLAAECGHTDIVRLLLEHGADATKSVAYSGTTPIMLAAEKGHLETLKLLLINGCDLDKADEGGQLCLHCAAEGDHFDVVKFILESGGNVLSKTGSGQTVLHLATRRDLVQFLVEKGADVHARDCYGRTPLHAASGKGQTDTVKYLLGQGANVDSRDDSGCLALYKALQGGHAATATVLIDSGCDLKLSSDPIYCKYLHRDLLIGATSSGLTEVLDILFQIGLPVDELTPYNKTPLMSAVRFGQCETVAFLLDRGANINGQTNKPKADEGDDHGDSGSDYSEEDDHASWYKFKHRSPLYCALEAGQEKVAKLLIERGADTSYWQDEDTSLSELAAKHGFSDILGLLGCKDEFHCDKIVDDDTLLTSAAGRGDIKSVRYLLQNGVDVNMKSVGGETALTSVIQFAYLPRVLEVVKLLISFGADINAKNASSQTPLSLACSRNFYQVAELLLEFGCETGSIYGDSFSPLHYASENNNGKLAEILLQYGADANVKDDKMTPLHVAASSSGILAAQVLIKHDADVEVVNLLGETPLAVAAGHGNLPMIKLLIESGANVHTQDKRRRTPLILALCNMRYLEFEDAGLAVVRYLLNRGSSVNATDVYGRSPVHYVNPSATREFFDLLLHHGALVNVPDENGETPLHFAASVGSSSSIEWLLEHGANVRAVDRENRTPLHTAAYEGRRSCVELLIQHGADVHVTDNKGWLPLHLTSFSGGVDVAGLLVENGSDVTVVDKKGRTLLHLAGKFKQDEFLEFLIHLGSDVNARDLSGQTVLGEISKCPYKNPEWNYIQIYLNNGGDVFAIDTPTGRTTLHFAATCNFVSTLDNLLNQGIEVDTRDKNGDTPLHRAAAYGASEVIERLIDRGADLSALNKKGRTPFLVSLKRNSNKMACEIFLKRGSSVHVADNEGNTALHFAVRHPSVLKEIVKKGGGVNAVNKYGCSPLHEAAYGGYLPDSPRLLIKAGADVCCQDEQGNTPFHVAVSRGNRDIAEFLIKNGSDALATNFQGKTCLHMSRYYGDNRLLERMIRDGLDVNAVDELGCTPLHIALLGNDQWLVELLLKNGGDCGAVDYKGATPLHAGCSSGGKETVTLLVNHGR